MLLLDIFLTFRVPSIMLSDFSLGIINVVYDYRPPGDPDFSTPSHIVDASVSSLQKGDHHYCPAAGIPELRQAVADSLNRRCESLGFAPSNVVIVPGGKPILFFGGLALLDPTDEVLLPDPGFPIYASVVNFVGARVVPYPLLPENGFRPTEAQLRSLLTPKTKILVLNSPHNPLGSVMTKEDLQFIVRLMKDFPRLWVIEDSVYDRLIFDGPPGSAAPTLLDIPEARSRLIHLNSFSKAYAMTGWRLGYGACANTAMVDSIARLGT